MISPSLDTDQRLCEELLAVSATNRNDARPPQQTKYPGVSQLQNFRDRVSNQALHAFGVPLRTREQTLQLPNNKYLSNRALRLRNEVPDTLE